MTKAEIQKCKIRYDKGGIECFRHMSNIDIEWKIGKWNTIFFSNNEYRCNNQNFERIIYSSVHFTILSPKIISSSSHILCVCVSVCATQSLCMCPELSWNIRDVCVHSIFLDCLFLLEHSSDIKSQLLCVFYSLFMTGIILPCVGWHSGHFIQFLCLMFNFKSS